MTRKLPAALEDAPVDVPARAPEERSRAIFERMYREEAAHVFTFISRLGVSSRECEDMLHDVFVTAMRRYSSYDPQRPLRPWLFGIAYRTHRDRRRRTWREWLTPFARHRDEPDEQVTDVERREAERTIRRALDFLDDEKRVAFVLHELQELSVAEVAEVCGAPVQTIYSRLEVARREFADAVKRIDGEEPHDG